MALINCPNCGKTISDKAEVCPHCGMQRLNQPSTPTPAPNPAPAPNPNPAPAPAPVQNQNPAPNPTPYPNHAAGDPYPQYPMNEPKKSNKGLIIGLVAALAALLLIGGGIGAYFYMNKSDKTETEIVFGPDDTGGGVDTPIVEKPTPPGPEGPEIGGGEKPTPPTGPENPGPEGGGVKPTPPQQPETTLYVAVDGKDVRLRTSPVINNKNIIKAPNGKNLHPNQGDRLEYLGEEGDFYLVKYKGHTAYISKQFTHIVEY